MNANLETLLAVTDANKRLQLIAELPDVTFEKSTLAVLRLVLQPYGKVRTARKAELITLVMELKEGYKSSLNKTLEAKMTAWVDGMRITDEVLAQLLEPTMIQPEREQLVMHCFQGLARSTITKTELPRLRAAVKRAIVNGRDDLEGFLDWLYTGFSDATVRTNTEVSERLMEKRESRVEISKTALSHWLELAVERFSQRPNPFDGAMIVAISTGRRSGEILATCDYRFEGDKLYVANLAKRRGNADHWDGVEIEVPILLLNPSTIRWIWDSLRAIMTSRGITGELDYRQLNKAISKPLHRVSKPLGISAFKDSRDVYAALLADSVRDGNVDPNLVVTRALGHGLPGETKIDATCLTYTKYRITA